MDTKHSYDFAFPDELSDESCSLSKTIVLTLMIITIILLSMYLGGFFLTEAEKQELQDFADQQERETIDQYHIGEDTVV